MTERKRTTAQPNQSIRNGFAILELLARSPEPRTTGELSDKLGLHPSVTSRLLLTLCEMGYVHRLRRGLWTPNVGLAALSSMGLRHTPIVNCIPILQRMEADLGLTVALGLVWRGEVVYLFQSAMENAVPGLGHSGDSSRSSIGRLLTADPMPDHYIIQGDHGGFTICVPLHFEGQTFGLAVTNYKDRRDQRPPTPAVLTAYAREIEALQHA